MIQSQNIISKHMRYNLHILRKKILPNVRSAPRTKPQSRKQRSKKGKRASFWNLRTLTPNSCGCGRGRIHVGGQWRNGVRGKRIRRNVCGADCGNVISRYVAVGRPSSLWHRHLPTTYDFSVASRRRRESEVVVADTPAAPHESVEANHRNFSSALDRVSFLAFTARFFFSPNSLPHLILATWSRGLVQPSSRKWISDEIPSSKIRSDISQFRRPKTIEIWIFVLTLKQKICHKVKSFVRFTLAW